MLSVPAISLQYIRVPVSLTISGLVHDPTTDTVEMAFIASTAVAPDPGSGDWKPAIWESSSPTYAAMCLVGPGGTVTLVSGVVYAVWVRVTDNPEIPVMLAGYVLAT